MSPDWQDPQMLATVRAVMEDVYAVTKRHADTDQLTVHVHDLIDIERKWGIS